MADVRSAARGTLEILSLVGILVLVALYAFHPIFSVDFFWHLKLGQLIDARGEIPRVDLFSAVYPDSPYVQFNWLWDLGTYHVYAAGGLTSVRVVQAFLMVGTFTLLYWMARTRLSHASLAFLVTALALVLFEDRFRARPSALVLGFTVALWPLLMGGFRNAGLGARVAVAGIALLWSNLHGGESLLMLASFGALSVGAWLDRRTSLQSAEVARRAHWLLGATAAGLVVSPTLVPGMLHWIEAVRPQIATGNEEWQPSWTMVSNGWTPAFVTIAFGPTVVALAYATSEWRRVQRHGRAAGDVGEWLLCGGYLLLAHHAVRNAVLCVLPFALLLRRWGQNADVAPAARTRGLVAAGVGAALLVAVSFDDAILEGYGGLEPMHEYARYDLAPDAHPVQAAAFLRDAGIEGGVLNEGSWGGYLIWETWPACHVFVDTRHHLTPEMWQVFQGSHNLLGRPGAMEHAFRRWGIELSVFRGPTFPLIVPLPGWQLLYKAGDQEVYQRAGGAHEHENLQRTRHWLGRQGTPVADDAVGEALASAATEVGARQWLEHPFQRRRMAVTQRLMRSDDDDDKAAGARIEGRLLFQAGLYRDALVPLRGAAEHDPRDPRPRYHAAMSHFALGERAEAARLLAELERTDNSLLDATQKQRLGLLARQLRLAAAAH